MPYMRSKNQWRGQIQCTIRDTHHFMLVFEEDWERVGGGEGEGGREKGMNRECYSIKKTDFFAIKWMGP